IPRRHTVSRESDHFRICHGMTVYRVQRKTYILIHAITLRSVPILPANHGTLHSHNSHAALIAGWITAIRIKRPGSLRFIESRCGDYPTAWRLMLWSRFRMPLAQIQSDRYWSKALPTDCPEPAHPYRHQNSRNGS